MEIWAADGEKGLMRGRGGQWGRMGPPGRALCFQQGKLFCAGQNRCFCYEQREGRPLFDFALPAGVCALAAGSGRLFALSSDADSVTAFSTLNGDPLLCAPAGDYPQALCLSPCGRYLAVAGGAAGEMLLLDQSLSCLCRHRVAGAACGVCFLPRSIGVLCAVGDGELSTRLVAISPWGVTEEIFSCPDPPCAVCALPGGQCLIGCHGAVWRLRADGKVSARFPVPYPARLRPGLSSPLIIDPWQGRISLPGGRVLYQGGAPEDAVVFPG